jgi:hypothetical protein
MALETSTRDGSGYGLRRERASFVLLYALCFTLVLATEIVSRLMPWRWPALFAADSASLFADVRTRTMSIVPFLFMG